MLNDLKEKLNENLVLIICLVGLVSIFILSNQKSENSQKSVPEILSPPQTADTYIPKGYVLVPIQIINKNQLSDLVGSFALVDLYSLQNLNESNKQEWQLFSSKIKLLRAPLNSQEFAVLAKEEESFNFVRSTGFWVTVYNYKTEGSAPRLPAKHSPKTNENNLERRDTKISRSRQSRRNKFDIQFGNERTKKEKTDEFIDRL